MQINWFTVIAQLINFLLLVWLMKKYLYQPILNAIDEREKKIAAELSDAKNKMAAAKKEQDEFQKKNEVFDRHQKKMMDKVSSDAEKEKIKLLDAAQKEADDLKQKRAEEAKELAVHLNKERSKKTQEEVLAITKKALTELASTNLEEQTVQVFINKIKSIAGKDKKQFMDAFHAKSSPLSVKSAFKLSAKEEKSIKVAIADLLGEDGDYEFKTDAKMMGGVELATEGYKLSWSFSAYISSLEKSIAVANNETDQALKK
nr:F0F1 ATP synthase subunit B [Pseudopedobacter sp.]